MENGMENTKRKRPARCMPSPTRQDSLAGRIIEKLAQDSGQEVQFRLVELWNNWKIVMGPLAGLAVPLGHRGKKLVIAAEDNMAQQELTFCTDEILARANSFLEEPYFTECQVKLRLGQKDLLNREEAHNAMFREAFNRVQDTGSNRDFGTTKAAKMYFSLSNPSPGQGFQNTKVNPPSFQ